MYRVPTTFRMFLLAALLWTQSVVALHDVEHMWHDDTEVCQVLSNAEHSKACVGSQPSIAVFEFDTHITPASKQGVPRLRLFKHPARAPPF